MKHAHRHAVPRERSLPIRVLRAARRHPVRTLQRADDELTRCTSFGIAQTVITSGFVLTAGGWVLVQMAHVLLSR